MTSKRGLFPALLRYWRNRRGLSQLDLALSADVSARHVSFLETGRARPSEEMLLQLAAALRIPLRDRNVMLHVCGFAPVFAEPDLDSELTPPVRLALERMLAQHEPYPLVIMDRHYMVKRTNSAAQRVLGRFVADPSAVPAPLNALVPLFDPRLARRFVLDWERSARGVLSRLHLEALEHPADTGLGELLDRLLAYPDVQPAWRQPDFSAAADATLTLRLATSRSTSRPSGSASSYREDRAPAPPPAHSMLGMKLKPLRLIHLVPTSSPMMMHIQPS